MLHVRDARLICDVFLLLGFLILVISCGEVDESDVELRVVNSSMMFDGGHTWQSGTALEKGISTLDQIEQMRLVQSGFLSSSSAYIVMSNTLVKKEDSCLPSPGVQNYGSVNLSSPNRVVTAHHNIALSS